MKIGDLKLLNIEVMQNGVEVYVGNVEDAPEALKETEYKTAKFDSQLMKLEI